MATDFYTGTDWSKTAEPMMTRQVELDMIWPHGAGSEIGGGDKADLVDGRHPIMAICAKADRNVNSLVGVVVTVNDDAELAQLQILTGHVTMQYVMNVLTYAQGNPATWAATWDVGQPVYVDDSADGTPGCVLSLSPLNSAGSANPLAGFLFPDQDEYKNFMVGGANVASVWPKTANEIATLEALLPVLLK